MIGNRLFHDRDFSFMKGVTDDRIGVILKEAATENLRSVAALGRATRSKGAAKDALTLIKDRRKTLLDELYLALKKASASLGVQMFGYAELIGMDNVDSRLVASADEWKVLTDVDKATFVNPNSTQQEELGELAWNLQIKMIKAIGSGADFSVQDRIINYLKKKA